MLTDLYPTLYPYVSDARRSQMEAVLKRMEDRLWATPGRRVNPARRTFIEHYREQLRWQPAGETPRHQEQARQRQKALGLAQQAGQYYDEHGPLGGRSIPRSEYRWTDAIDYVPPAEAIHPPYLDSGHAGLGLITITRRRNYASSSKWGPSYAMAAYVVGRNETGTFFAHPVPGQCRSVKDALNWLWNGHAADLVARQGDIAIIRGRSGPFPRLPQGHLRENGHITHPQHPALRLPGKGERRIVAKRIMPRVSRATRD